MASGALGECLTVEKRFPESESLLVKSYDGLKARVGEHDPRTTEAAGRLVALYEAWGKPGEASRYRQ